MKNYLAILVFLLTLVSCSTQESSEDSCTSFDALDLKMLNLIEQIQLKHKDDAKFLHNFNMEQVYWIQYRDTHLKAIYPRDWSRHYRKKYGKELFNPCKCKEMTRYTQERIKELKLWLNKGPEGQDDCPSLWRE